MLRKTLTVVISVAGLVFAQNAEVNAVIDDSGGCYINGTLITFAPRQGSTGDTTAAPCNVIPGATNAIAILCHDGGWTGGICASVHMPGLAESVLVVTDGSWKCMDRPKVANLTGETIGTTGFDDSQWFAPGDYGYLADDTGGHPKPFFERMGLEPFNLWSMKAKWLWSPPTIYIRKTFTTSATSGTAMIRGHGYTFKLYLNGREVGSYDEESDNSRLFSYPGQALNSGAENVIAIEATCVDDINFAFIKAGVGAGATVFRSDETWKYSWTAPEGWNNTGFDDSQWIPCGVKTAYDGTTDALTPAKYIWCNDLWFRKEFSVPDVGLLRGAKSAPSGTKATSTQYFTLQGKQIPVQVVKGLIGKAAIVERSVLNDGRVVSKIVQAK